jgi:hypothetical protein
VDVPEERVAPEHELLLHLEGLAGPVATTQLLDHAQRSGAPAAVVATLAQLRERTWTGIEDAVAAIGTGWSPSVRVRSTGRAPARRATWLEVEVELGPGCS